MLSMIKKYILQKVPLFSVIIITAIIFFIVFITENIPIDTVFYALLISAFAFLLYLIIDFFYYLKKIKRLYRVRSDVLHKTDNLPKVTNESDKLYSEIIENWEIIYNKFDMEQTKKLSEISDFYTKWVHQIKTPIFALSLLVKDLPNNNMMLSELNKIEQYTGMVLSYLRLFESDNDLVIKEVNIKNISSDVLKNFTPIFLSKGLRPVLEVDDLYIKTDEKHLKFAISQIISNACKYSEKSDIHITLKDNVLRISDKGIGIDSSDLPRIFDKGFTGFSGRIEEKSTGLGLYLCKKTLDILGFSISAVSEKWQGTDVFVNLSQQNRLHE